MSSAGETPTQSAPGVSGRTFSFLRLIAIFETLEVFKKEETRIIFLISSFPTTAFLPHVSKRSRDG